MKKKLIPFILGLSMIAATPLAAHAADTPEEDSGNVTYGDFASITDEQSGETPVVTAIPECTMTIPRDTTIKKGAKSANIGRVTIDGHYFVKPYYVEVSATRDNFVKVDDTTGARLASRTANQDIIFDVATSLGAPSSSGTAAANENFVQTGTIGIDGSSHVTTYTNGTNSEVGDRACRRFWKQEKLTANQDVAYKDGEVCDINGQEDVCLRIAETQWTGDAGNLDNTKPVGGQYKGSITFTATFRDNYTDGMPEWIAYPLS
jgi:hypothetical protein